VNLIDAIEPLRRAGWMIRPADPVEPLPPDLLRRYPGIPPEVQAFQTGLSLATNSDETSWFLTRDDYAGESRSVFAWNEFETLSLDDGESGEARARITAFWDRHYPVLLSVKASSYLYFALDLGAEPPGGVVHGLDPFFEETRPTAGSFAEFLALLADAASGKGGPEFLRLVL
jgi:hypothetical protein